MINQLSSPLENSTDHVSSMCFVDVVGIILVSYHKELYEFIPRNSIDRVFFLANGVFFLPDHGGSSCNGIQPLHPSNSHTPTSINGVYGTYHLLREPGNSIDFSGFLSNHSASKGKENVQKPSRFAKFVPQRLHFCCRGHEYDITIISLYNIHNWASILKQSLRLTTSLSLKISL